MKISLNIWLQAIRPKTLPAAVAPVLIGTAMAYADGFAHYPSAFAALIGALAIQVLTNLANDYFDFKKGADTKDRIGPTRVMQAGLVSDSSMKNAMLITAGVAVLASFYLITRAGWPILLIGIVSIVSGIFYTAGPRPLGYLGLGDVFVLIFFGPVAVGGTYYVQALSVDWVIIIAGLAPGLLSAAILCVNNLRDMDTDRKVSKLTLAVRLGRSFALSEYLFCIISASFIPLVLCVLLGGFYFSLLASAIAYLSIPVIKTVLTKADGHSLNRALAQTGQLLLAYSILFSIGWIQQ